LGIRLSIANRYGEKKITTQTFLEGDDAWAIAGTSWHWVPVIADHVFEKKDGV